MERISYDNFRQKLHSKSSQDVFPLRAMFELTYDCNFRCKHCYVPPAYRIKYRRKQLKTKEVFSVLDQLKDIGCFYIGFTGGEPFFRPDIMRILEYAKRQGFQISIYTNGSLLNDRIIRNLAKINPNKVDITLPGISRAVFERVTGAVGSYNAVFKAINLLYKNKINLGFKTCLLKENFCEISQINKFAKSLSAQHRLDTLLCARLDGSNLPYQYRKELPEAKRSIRVRNFKDRENCGLGKSKDSVLFKCGVGKSQAAITPGGELKLCLMIDRPKYNLLKMPLSKAWEKVKNFINNIKLDKTYLCPECQLESYCKWCPARSWMHNKTYFSCDPQMRAWAQRIKGWNGN